MSSDGDLPGSDAGADGKATPDEPVETPEPAGAEHHDDGLDLARA